MSGARWLGALSLMAFAALASAANRCALPSGRILYTSETCESAGAKPDRPVKSRISLVRAQDRTSVVASGAPVISVCYDPKNIRPEVTHEQVQDSIRAAAVMWNSGCRVSFEYHGICGAGPATRLRIWWHAYDASKKVVAGAHRASGIGINLTLESAAFERSFHRAMLHEFGHLAGVGHSADPRDLMYPGGQAYGATAADFRACNEAIDTHYGRGF
jgi:hypothetical protein